jgi:hypothetical protein
MTHTVAPWRPDRSRIPLGQPLPDHGKFVHAAGVRD